MPYTRLHKPGLKYSGGGGRRIRSSRPALATGDPVSKSQTKQNKPGLESEEIVVNAQTALDSALTVKVRTL